MTSDEAKTAAVHIISDFWLGGIEPAQARQRVADALGYNVPLDGVIKLYARLTELAEQRVSRVMEQQGWRRYATRRG